MTKVWGQSVCLSLCESKDLQFSISECARTPMEDWGKQKEVWQGQRHSKDDLLPMKCVNREQEAMVCWATRTHTWTSYGHLWKNLPGLPSNTPLAKGRNCSVCVHVEFFSNHLELRTEHICCRIWKTRRILIIFYCTSAFHFKLFVNI